jgi:hypothetical protein
VEERQTQKSQTLLSERTCGFESHPPHQIPCQTPTSRSACVDLAGRESTYVYLLGLYLGDGCISRLARTFFIRISQDTRYPGLIAACSDAVEVVSRHRAGIVRKRDENCVDVYGCWNHWPCAFPQHGRGPKHLRPILLAPWQRGLVEEYPKQLIRGLIHSDGCRCVNRIRRPLKDGIRTYEYVRYFFTNLSADISALFTWVCELVGVECRPTNDRNISVAKRESVRLLDEFVGPKS